jgi:hypothetical protein
MSERCLLLLFLLFFEHRIAPVDCPLSAPAWPAVAALLREFP